MCPRGPAVKCLLPSHSFFPSTHLSSYPPAPSLSHHAPSPSPTTMSLTPSSLLVQCCLYYMSILKLTPHSVLRFSLVPGRCFTPIGELNKWMSKWISGFEYVVAIHCTTKSTFWCFLSYQKEKPSLMGWIVSPRKICWGPHLQDLRIWPYLEMEDVTG